MIIGIPNRQFCTRNIFVFYVIITLLCISLSASCSKKKTSTTNYDKIEKIEENNGYVWYKVSKGDKCGALNSNKKSIVPIKYDNVHFYSWNIIEGFVAEIYYSESLSGTIEFYDTKGKKKIDKSKGIRELLLREDINGNFYYICTSQILGKFSEGVMDSNFNIIIEPIYDNIYYSLECNVDDYKKEKGGYFTVEIDNESEIIFCHLLENGSFSKIASPYAMFLYKGIHPDYGDYDDDELAYDIIGEEFQVYFFDKQCFIKNLGYFTFDYEMFCEGYGCYSDIYRQKISETKYRQIQVIDNNDKEWINVSELRGEHSRNAVLEKKHTIYPISEESVSFRKNLYNLLKASIVSGNFTELNNLYKEKQAAIQNISNLEIEESGIYNSDGLGPNSSALSGSTYPSFPSNDNERQNLSNDFESKTPIRKPCAACANSGQCRVCNGTGQVISPMSLTTPMETQYMKCRSCGGGGRCSACGGDGWIEEGKDF